MTEEQVAHVRDWIAALRSGEMKQGRGCLMDTLVPLNKEGDQGVCFCCLGVACEVSRLGRWELVVTERSCPGYTYVPTGEPPQDGPDKALAREKIIWLPVEVMQSLGLRSPKGAFKLVEGLPQRDRLLKYMTRVGREHNLSLVSLNDSLSCTFREIADVVEFCLGHPETEMFQSGPAPSPQGPQPPSTQLTRDSGPSSHELFHFRAQGDPRYTSPDHGIELDEYVPEWDEELLDFQSSLRDRLYLTVREFES